MEVIKPNLNDGILSKILSSLDSLILRGVDVNYSLSALMNMLTSPDTFA